MSTEGLEKRVGPPRSSEAWHMEWVCREIGADTMFRGHEWPGSATDRPWVRKRAVPKSPTHPGARGRRGSGEGRTLYGGVFSVSVASSYTAIKIQLKWVPALFDFSASQSPCSGHPRSRTLGAAEAPGERVGVELRARGRGGQDVQDGGWSQNGGLGTVMVGGAGAPGGGP